MIIKVAGIKTARLNTVSSVWGNPPPPWAERILIRPAGARPEQKADREAL